MTRAPTQTPQDRDALAAEYVLGVLDAADRAAVETRLRNDRALADAITAWEDRLSPLNDAYDEVPAPNLLPAIEARIFGTAPARRPWYRALWVQATGGATAATALLLSAYLVLAPPLPGIGPAPVLTAALAGDASVTFAAVWDGADLAVTRVSGAAPGPDQAHELWLIGANGVPVSLGVLPDGGLTRPLPELAAGMVLAVSLEAAGGSVTGSPATVLVTGVVTEIARG